MIPRPEQFEFTSYTYDHLKRHASFTYRYLQNGKEIARFSTQLSFPMDIPTASEVPAELLDRALHALHLILGISYWKVYCPKEILIATKALTKEQATFWNTVYTKGLGEFFYRNQIDFCNLIQFPFDETQNGEAIPFPRQDRALVGFGGGKDSIVIGEWLKEKNYPQTALIVETQRPHTITDEVVKAMEIETIRVQQTIDSQLFEFNKQEGTYNGHIPISAVFAFVAIFTAILYDYRYAIVGNERSANIGNVDWLGECINHQWSKSAEFEHLFQNYIKQFVTPSVVYFSPLRQWSELQVVQSFSHYPQYFSLFSSCNRNFTISKERLSPETRWCGACPKCAFVFILLTAFLPKDAVVSIFQKNLLEDNNLLDLYRQLSGIKDFKPFECVGTFEETKAAFMRTKEKHEFDHTVAMNMFETEVLPTIDNYQSLRESVYSDSPLSFP